jgi:outer membrane protein TolC
LWNRNRRAIAEARAARDAARVEAEAALEAVVGEWAQAEAHVAAASQVRKSLAEKVAPLVDVQVQETQQLLDLGEVDVLVLLKALTTSMQTKLEILDATLAEAVARNRLRNMVHPRWVARSAREDEP